MTERDYVSLKAPGPLDMEEVMGSEDLELWIIRVSPQVEVAHLAGCKLPLTQGRTTRSGQLQLSAETFTPRGLHLLLPNPKGRKLKPVALPVRGQVQVHPSLAVTSPSDVTAEGVTSREPRLPAARPDRHPLLGVGYEKTLAHSRRALELSQACSVSDTAAAGRKRNKSPKGLISDVDSLPVVETSSLATSGGGKKRRKSRV